MRPRVLAILWLPLFLFGCATDRGSVEEQNKIMPNGPYLSDPNPMQGLVYEVRFYIIAKGDSFPKIAKQFQMSLTDLHALNPGLNPKRLYIGHPIRIFEQRRN